MLGQCWAIVLLKFAVLRHTWSTGRIISTIVMGFFLLLGVVAAIASAAGGYYAGRVWLGTQEPLIALVVLDGIVTVFLFIWFWSLLIEIQRADIIDFKRMMFFPISLRLVFFLNFITSLLSPALVLFIPGLIALLFGMSTVQGPHVLWGVPLSLVFFLMLTAWAYYARGIMSILMENKRRRRLILMLLPLCFALLPQAPNLIVHSLRTNKEAKEAMKHVSAEQAEQWLHYGNIAVPVGWLPYGIWSLQNNHPQAAGLCCIGMGGLALLGLGMGYRSTVRYYRGETNVRRVKKSVRKKTGGKPLTARWLPLLDEDTAAMTWAAYINYARHPNIRMLLIMPPIMAAIILFTLKTGIAKEQMGGNTTWLPAALLVWPYFNFSMVFFNIFGTDHAGFRGLLLLPAPRHKYILAKNIALFPFVAGMGVFFVLGGGWLLETPPRILYISLVQVFEFFLIYCLIGNFISLYFPYRLGRDTMRAQGNRPILLLMGLCSAAFVGLLMLPAMFCLALDDFVAVTWGYRGLPIGLITSLILLALTALAYAMALVHAGDLLLSREQRILAALVKDRE